MSSTPSADVLERRAAALVSALANAQLERGAPSDEARLIFEAWARGELTDEQRSEAIASLPV